MTISLQPYMTTFALSSYWIGTWIASIKLSNSIWATTFRDMWICPSIVGLGQSSVTRMSDGGKKVLTRSIFTSVVNRTHRLDNTSYVRCHKNKNSCVLKKRRFVLGKQQSLYWGLFLAPNYCCESLHR